MDENVHMYPHAFIVALYIHLHTVTLLQFVTENIKMPVNTMAH